MKLIIVQNIDSSMIGSKVVDLFAPYGGPDFLADEFEDVQGVCEAGTIAREVFGGMIANVVSDAFETVDEHAFDFGECLTGRSFGAGDGAYNLAVRRCG